MSAHCLSRRSVLAALAHLGALPLASLASPATPLLLALDAPADVDPAGYLVSEKFDGVRAWWDGQTLRFRSGLPIAAPAWFLDLLPAAPLDGELWLGRGRFEALSGAVRRARPSTAEWREIRYQVFELPGASGTFAQRAARIPALLQDRGSPQLLAVAQRAISTRAELQAQLKSVVAQGGEGLMLHRADAPFVAGRSAALLKLKPVADADAVVLGHQPGRGKHDGRLGALHVRGPGGVQFYIGTGFSDAEREDPPAVGSVVTYTHRGLTEAGVPRFASYLRRREAGV
jgi:DNA ligase-1